MDLLKFIPPNKRDYYRNLETNRHDGISNVCNNKAIIIIYVITLTIIIVIIMEL